MSRDRSETPPCDLCGTTGGPPIAGQHRHRPARYRGDSYGIEGLICRECRDDLIDELIDAETRALGIEERVAAVRHAKLAKLHCGLYGCDALTANELDAVMPLEDVRHRCGQFPFGEVG